MNRHVATSVQTPADLFHNEIAFVIPSYQRPYVWPDDDVLKLLDDIYTASKAGEKHYYIGTLLMAESSEFPEDGSRVFELIDGQQRATTLMLIALALQQLRVETPLARIATLYQRPRLTFVIRDQVQSLLGAWAGLQDYTAPDGEAIKRDPYLTRLDGALQVLHQRLKKLDTDECYRLAKYIYKNVQWVSNIVPCGMDLNRLFATMNTSGLQLEQSDILKSLLLKKVKTNKARYEAMWQACEQMENYFERNVRQIFSESSWNRIKPDDLKKFDPDVLILANQDTGEGKKTRWLTLDELAAGAEKEPFLRKNETKKKSEGKNNFDEMIFCRSIIGFPLLLMHAYRIFREESTDITVRLHSDRLIESFRDLVHSSERVIKSFIECLWQVRYQFDRWVVKWVRGDGDEEEILGLTSTSHGKTGGKRYIQRSQRGNSALTLLQSVRYFTGEHSAQYWLTPFLGWLIWLECKKEDDVTELLEDIDNQLSLAIRTQKEASFMLLSDDLESDEIRSYKYVEEYLTSVKGTRFEHYWFQKLEYLLWKAADKSNEKRLQKYRILSRNSVEHVHPQNEEYKKTIKKEDLNAFGNLALLNPGQNSSYSNQKVEKKKIDFLSKPSYDSLKLKHIFELMDDEGWTVDVIKKHEQQMLRVFSTHYEAYK